MLCNVMYIHKRVLFSFSTACMHVCAAQADPGILVIGSSTAVDSSEQVFLIND